MDKQFKPTDYNSVSPYFIVNGAQQLVAMLKHVFNGKEKRRFDTPDGKIMHIEVQLDDSIIMIADSTDKYPPNQFLVHVYVPNVDDTFNKAISYGCIAVEQPTQKDGDPDRRGSFKDFAGNNWSVGTQVS
jgi:PhnB protein